MSGSALPKVRDAVVLADSEKRIHQRRSEIKLHHFAAIQPMLAVIPAEKDHRAVPLADWLERLARVRRNKIIERAGPVRRDLVVFVEIIVKHLILEPQRG